MVDTTEFNRSLEGAAASGMLGLSEAGMVMHGAHGNPMRGRPGRPVARRYGRPRLGFRHTVRAGRFRRCRGVRLRVRAERRRDREAGFRAYSSQQDSLFGGSTRISGTYLLPEVTARIGETPWHATLSGY